MPNRIIKESICSSATIDGLSWFEEVFFYRLIVNCDDYGRFDARPAILKARLFPLKDLATNQVNDALYKLVDVGLVRVYGNGDKKYLQLNTWGTHQTIRNKRSKYPAPDDENMTLEINCKQMQASENNCVYNPIQSESNPNPNPIYAIISDYKWIKLTQSQYDKLKADYPNIDIDNQIKLLDEYVQSNGNKNKYKDFNLVLRKSIRENWFNGKRFSTIKNEKAVPDWFDKHMEEAKKREEENRKAMESEENLRSLEELAEFFKTKKKAR